MNIYKGQNEAVPMPYSGIISSEHSHEALTLKGAAARGLFGFSSRDKRSRPFNLLRSQVLKMLSAKDWKVIGVTSATPGVGKSFTASNLAAALSRIPDMKTLLFDLDLRRCTIAETFGIPQAVGLNSFLTGEIDTLENAAYDIAGTNLTVFPCFRGAEASAELLAGSRLRDLIAAMRNLPDKVVCICDLPPAFANDDAAIVLRDVDAYLFVVEEGKTTARQVKDAIEILKPAPCMGTILNRYHGTIGSDDYGFGYGTSRYYDAYYN